MREEQGYIQPVRSQEPLHQLHVFWSPLGRDSREASMFEYIIKPVVVALVEREYIVLDKINLHSLHSRRLACILDGRWRKIHTYYGKAMLGKKDGIMPT